MRLIHFLFDRRSFVVLLLALSTLYFFYHHVLFFSTAPMESAIASGILTALYSFAFFCRFYPWYPATDRGHGIEDHFAKIFVASVYVYSLSSLVFFLSHISIFIWIGILFFLYPVSTNLILIYFYFKDASPIPPSYHSRSLYDVTMPSRDSESVIPSRNTALHPPV